uniref:Centrosomal protein 128 n=1 Tax=Amphiprion percula TaxID=161767 RepID=A0A3P8TCJ1_AMPPE
MDTSSGSDSYDRMRGHRPRGRETHRKCGRDRGRTGGSGGDGPPADISEKISTLANTLQDTSRNLTKVDRMLGQYREHTDDQAEAMALLRENLEDSISQLQAHRLSRPNGTRSASASASTLHTSDLDACSESALDSFAFLCLCLLFCILNEWICAEQIHTMHQSLRDLRCNQQRLSDDLDREILRRNRYLLGEAKSEQKKKEISLECFTRHSVSHHCACCCFNGFYQQSHMCLWVCLDRSDLEKEVAELRVQLCKVSVQSEVEELKRALNRKEKERVELSLQVKVGAGEMSENGYLCHTRPYNGSDLVKALLQESTRSRDELKTRAQEAVRQWRAKCRRLQKGLDEAQSCRVETQQTSKWQRSSQQTEAARRELAEILGRLAQREEELHRKDVELSESHQRQLSLQEASATLEEEAQRQAAILARLREENQRLEERADTQARRCQRDQDAQAELQAALKQMTTAHAQLAQRLAEEESSRKELQKGTSELQVKLTALQEERDALSQQLQLEREVHQKELDNTKAMVEDSRIKKDREVQDMLRLCRQEREEIQSHLREADAASDKELCGALHIKLDRMKDECDKLAAQLSTKDEAHALLHRKYQLLKQEVEDKVRSGERRRASESEFVKLEQKVLQMEAEQEAVLTSMGEELDAACRSLARNGEDKLQVFTFITFCLLSDLSNPPVTKLRWLCEEVRERDTREQRLRRQHQQTRDQLKALRQSRDSEQATLLQLHQQQHLFLLISELLERSRRKEDEMRSLQVSIMFSSNTRVALDHLESIPEKPCLMENFKDLEESQQQRELVEQRYTKYKEIIWDLQHQLDESKRRIQEYRPTLFLFQSLIAPLCSNSSCLDKDSLTLRAIYESSSPTRMPMCAPHLICNLHE